MSSSLDGFHRLADRPRARARAMLAVAYVAVFVAALWLPFVHADAVSRAGARASAREVVGEVNWWLASLLLFNAVNALICVWEIALWVHRDEVQRLNRGYLKKFGKRVRWI